MSPAGKDDSAAVRKSGSSRPPEPALKCPRCDSPNTKFCYYNNYSLTQPRHFCKTCRRYWTKGGALRNVPIGGGCRKNKKMKSSPCTALGGVGDASSCRDSIGSSDIGGLKFFQGVSPAMDFQITFPRIHHGGPNSGAAAGGATSLISQFVPLGHSPNSCEPMSPNPNFNFLDPNFINPSSSSLIGFANFPISSGMNQEIGSLNVHSSLASSIESLSSINQDLHWKLQQQRLGMIPAPAASMEHLVINQKPQPIVFDISKQDVKKDLPLSTEWFFDTSMAANQSTGTSSSGGGNGGTGNNWTGMQAWNTDHLGPFTASSLP